MNAFIKLIEAPLDELFLIQEEVREDMILSTYAEILQAYLRSDISALILLQEKTKTSPLLHTLLKLRLGIRERVISEVLFKDAADLLSVHPEWAGEIHFVWPSVFGPDFYSTRNASIGSSRAARQAG